MSINLWSLRSDHRLVFASLRAPCDDHLSGAMPVMPVALLWRWNMTLYDATDFSFLYLTLIDWPHVQPCRWFSSGFVANLWASSRPVLQESVANVQPHLGRPFFHGKIGCNSFWIVSGKLNLKPETIHAFVIFRKTGTFPENSHPSKLKTRAWSFRSSGPKKLLEHNTWTTLALLWMYIFSDVYARNIEIPHL